MSRNSQSHQAYLALETLIVTLRLKPGMLVTEKQLIDMAGQGRTPVREAIQKLAWEGLIYIRPRVGMQIAEIGSIDHHHVMQVRRKLEPLAVSMVAADAKAPHREELLACAQQMMGCAVSGDIGGFLVADKRFDDVVEDACSNVFLTAALAPLQTHSRRLWFSTATLERMDRSVTMHVGVIRAIQQGDGPAAEKAMLALLDELDAASLS